MPGRRPRWRRRPTKTELRPLLEQAQALLPGVQALRNYERNARDAEWADLGDNFSPMAMFAAKDLRSCIYFLSEALKEAR